MSETPTPIDYGAVSKSKLPEGEQFKRFVSRRRTIGTIWRRLFFFCTVIGLVMLVLLLYNVINNSFGFVAVQTRIPRDELTNGRELDALPKDELLAILNENLTSARKRAIERDDGPLAERSEEDLLTVIREQVLREQLVNTWTLRDSLFNRAGIEAEAAERFPRAELRFHSWVNMAFLTSPGASNAWVAGIGPAIAGTLWIIIITMLIAIPLGISAAIYMEEYAANISAAGQIPGAPLHLRFLGWLNRLIQTNINNLAGVPSIIYGILGLAIFVRSLSQVTSGASFGYAGADPRVGRSIISASLTMALLILPVIIIAAQEAIRAVPNSIRQASLALGATKWQTIWNQVLPTAFPSILTGIILSMSRAIGETAPLVVIGAATLIFLNPDSPFARFTALPIQIFQWASRPEPGFNNASSAAIMVLLVILLALNSFAVYLRYRFRRTV